MQSVRRRRRARSSEFITYEVPGMSLATRSYVCRAGCCAYRSTRVVCIILAESLGSTLKWGLLVLPFFRCENKNLKKESRYGLSYSRRQI